MINSVENKIFDACGSHLQGNIIDHTYDELVHSFGEPTIVDGPCDKTRVEWNLTFDLEDGETVKATVYDYCNDEPLDENRFWSIGGWNHSAYTLVASTLYLDHKIWESI